MKKKEDIIMKNIVCFHLEGCPYCHKAIKAFKELQAENAEFEKVPVEWVEDSKEKPSTLKDFDYYYVPTIYVGDEKIYEASPADDYEAIKSNVRKSLEVALT